MRNSYFQFKQFKIEQTHAAMKVSTDACIQGAWTPIPTSARKVLDIGCGTGLLSLMLAQRSPDLLIDAVEIDQEGSTDAAQNFANSPWNDRLKLSIGDARAMVGTHQYDLIICNPPFFNNSLLGPTDKRNTARHSLQLTQQDLFIILSQQLTPPGVASILLPAAEFKEWKQRVTDNGWFFHSILEVKPKHTAAVNRIISTCSATEQETSNTSLVIYDADSQYTKEFAMMLSPFYLKL